MIYAHPPMVLYNGSSVTVCFSNGDKMVSLALDNSCSGDRAKLLSRGDLALFAKRSGGKDTEVTSDVFGNATHEVVHASLENFEKAMSWLRQTQWGFGSQESDR